MKQGESHLGRQIKKPEPTIKAVTNDIHSTTCAGQELKPSFKVPT